MKNIDLENHFYSKAYFDYTNGRTEFPRYDKNVGLIHREGAVFPVTDQTFFNPPHTCIEEVTDIDARRLSIMDACGVTNAVISSIDGMEDLPKDECIRMAKATNDEIAAAVRKHPDRFFGSFCLPSPYIEESLEEIDRAVDVLGLKYWHTHSSYAGCALDDEKFEPIFAKLAEKDLAFYVHPAYPSDPYLLDSGIAFGSAGFGFGVDTMKTTIRLILGGVFDRYPNLKMILGHMAEFYPYLCDRMDNRFNVMKPMDPIHKKQHDFEYYFKNRNIFMTTSGIFDPDVALFAIKKFGVESVLFGTDYPCESFKGSREFIESLPISNEDKEKIFYKNAEKYILKK